MAEFKERTSFLISEIREKLGELEEDIQNGHVLGDESDTPGKIVSGTVGQVELDSADINQEFFAMLKPTLFMREDGEPMEFALVYNFKNPDIKRKNIMSNCKVMVELCGGDANVFKHYRSATEAVLPQKRMPGDRICMVFRDIEPYDDDIFEDDMRRLREIIGCEIFSSNFLWHSIYAGRLMDLSSYRICAESIYKGVFEPDIWLKEHHTWWEIQNIFRGSGSYHGPISSDRRPMDPSNLKAKFLEDIGEEYKDCESVLGFDEMKHPFENEDHKLEFDNHDWEPPTVENLNLKGLHHPLIPKIFKFRMDASSQIVTSVFKGPRESRVPEFWQINGDRYYLDENLFRDKFGRAFKFLLHPMIARNSSRYHGLNLLIRDFGGKVEKATGPGTISILDIVYLNSFGLDRPKEIQGDGDLFSSNFLYDCVRQNRVLDLNEYKAYLLLTWTTFV